jgi:AcrR family transcriptional regulator
MLNRFPGKEQSFVWEGVISIRSDSAVDVEGLKNNSIKRLNYWLKASMLSLANQGGEPLTEDEQRQKRGEATRAALIQAGLELFGEYGFQPTTTRMLCDHAGANISAIPYYFGGKRGLYHAVLQYIVAQVQANEFGDKEAMQAMLARTDQLTPEMALAILKQVVTSVASFFLKSEEPRKWMQIMLREQAKPTEGFDIVYNNHIKHMQAVFTRLIGICLDLDPNSTEVKLRGHAIFGQVMGFLIAREALLRMLGVRQLEAHHADEIKAVLCAHLDAILMPRPKQEEGS